MPVEDIKNFLPVGDLLGTAGQPTEAQVREIAEAGYQVVVNLGLLDPRYCLPDEAGLVASLGMDYHHIPVKFDAPQFSDLERFTQVMTACAGRKVFVHCAMNWRVSMFVALDHQWRKVWSAEQADLHARVFWEPNEIWTHYLAECRQRMGRRNEDR